MDGILTVVENELVSSLALLRNDLENTHHLEDDSALGRDVLLKCSPDEGHFVVVELEAVELFQTPKKLLHSDIGSLSLVLEALGDQRSLHRHPLRVHPFKPLQALRKVHQRINVELLL